ncbi:MAG: energy-coupling factor transporter ATPase [Clostridia bacterium]|nr:energy-coupling factor transporter ATPase [Clostridia bacterium]
MDNTLIRTENLTFFYEGEDGFADTAEQKGVKNINLIVNRGEYVAILGHNGSGKSTLAKLLNMILSPTSGKIFIDGVDITREDFTEDGVFDVRRKVGMVFQNPDNQLVATVVEEDVAFGPENLGLPREEIRRRVNSALAKVKMTEYARHAPHKLSGGQKQRVAIAGIIAMKPDVIIFDESTAMLDPIGRRDVIDIMKELNRNEKITVINITHYMDEAAGADRVVVISEGEIVMDGTPREVFSDVKRLHKMGLEAPQSSELLTELNSLGLGIQGEALTCEECVELLLTKLDGHR